MPSFSSVLVFTLPIHVAAVVESISLHDKMHLDIDAHGNLRHSPLRAARDTAEAVRHMRAPADIVPPAPVASDTSQLSASPRKGGGRDVIVCRGIGDMTEGEINTLGSIWKNYAERGTITGTSALLYKIDKEGKFTTLVSDKPLEEHTQKYLSPKGAKALPHVWCDNSCCENCPLPGALTAAMGRRDAFFEESIQTAKQFSWDGYALDFEGAMPRNASETTLFFKDWQEALAKHTGPSGKPLELHLWTGSNAKDDAMAQHLTSLIDMSAYYFGDAQSSLLEDAQSSRKASAKLCPKGYGAPVASSTAASFLEARRTEIDRYSNFSLAELDDLGHKVADGLQNHLTSWCEKTGPACAFGLITYDLANTALSCQDMVQVAHHANQKNVESIWLWTGGIIPSHWETGFQHYTSGRQDQVNAADACSAGSPGQVILASTDSSRSSQGCGSDCKFDAHYCCNGLSKTRSAQ